MKHDRFPVGEFIGISDEALLDVAVWLGFVNEQHYNDWCVTVTAKEFHDRLQKDA